tara:strand:+ start:58 stop:285 length:228 start_codon:yes stop_codon:yes gene_type:complete
MKEYTGFDKGDLVAVYQYFDPNNLHGNFKKRLIGLVTKREEHQRKDKTHRFYEVAFVGSDEIEPRWLAEDTLIRI